MKLLKTIKEEDIFPDSHLADVSVVYEDRFAARAIVFDAENNIALLYVSKRGYCKLPGGGIEKGESIVGALKRECLEEIGCNIVVEKELGEIVEYRQQQKMKQTSYCYTARLDGPKGQEHLEQGEIDDGFKPIWVTLDKAIDLTKQSRPDVYNGKFITVRDLTFLEAAKSAL